ncbi:MAG: type IV secretion protein IcmE, partial [Legionellaceae bacterium]
MAERKENIKSLFSNTRTRVIIILTTLVLVATVTVGFVKFGKSSDVLSEKNKIKSSPARLRSIPGSSDQTAQYAALQEIQNIEQAKKADKSGNSAIPTIIRTQAFGEGVEMIGPQGGEGGVGFTTLAQADDIGPQQSLWTQSLKDGKCTPDVIKRVTGQGAMLNDLKSACSCTQLRDFGYSLKELTTVCTCVELKEAGFSAANMKAIDFDIEKLRRCGFSACEVRGADFTAKQMVLGGFTQGELKGAGFPLREIEQANALPEGVSVDDVRKAGCLPEELAKLRKKGVSAAEIVRISGCDASALKAAGFSAKELKDAGFSAKELKDAGFSAAQLKA